jgi:hypothetical protein
MQTNQSQLPFTHHHTFLSPYGTLENPPFISNIITKPLADLISLPHCPAQFTQLWRIAAKSNVIILISSVLNRHTIQVFLQDSRTDKITIYKDWNADNDIISAICIDAKNPQFFFAISEGGLFAEFDLFSSQLLPKQIIPKKKGTQITAIATNGQIIAVASASNMNIYDRKSGKLLASDREMHQSDITAIAFHPQHINFLFSADVNGMINAYQLEYQQNDPTMGWITNKLDELYIATMQLSDEVDSLSFFGPNPKNYCFITAVSKTTSMVSLISFDCLDETSEFEVVQTNLKNVLNESILNTFQFNPEQFFLEFSDDLAEQNLTAGYTIEENPNGNAVPVDFEQLSIGADYGSDSMSMSSVKTAQFQEVQDDVISAMSNEEMTPAPIVLSSAELLSNMLHKEDDNGANIVQDDANHPRLWRVTNILNSQFSLDFTLPETPGQTPPYELFVTAATSGGGVVMATVTIRLNEVTGKKHIVVTKLIPLVMPFLAHDTSVCDATLILSDLKSPILLIGGRDGRLSLFNTHVAHALVEAKFPAIFAEIAHANSAIEDGPKKKKGTRRGGGGGKKVGTAGSKTQSTATMAGFDGDMGTGKPSGGSGKKNGNKKF